MNKRISTYIKKDYLLEISLISCLLYTIFNRVLHLDGFSLQKVLYVSFALLSVFVMIYGVVKRKAVVNSLLPFKIYIVWILLLIWNFITIFRDLVDSNANVATLFGHDSTGLPLFFPLVLVFGLQEKGLNSFLTKSKLILKIGILLFPLAIVINTYEAYIVIFYLLTFSIFCIPSLSVFSKNSKLLIVLSALILIIVAINYTDNRTSILRVLLLCLAIIPVFFYKRIKVKIWLWIPFLLLFLVSLVFLNSILNNESLFAVFFEYFSNDAVGKDTRTFLYADLIEDMIESDSLIIGKGALGHYYSDYFNYVDGDSAFRISVEVGLLALLLKGGLIAVILNLFLFVMAIKLALFHSNNLFVKGVAFFLIIHVLLLFVENLIRFDIYNFLVWLFVGAALSKRIRYFNDDQLKLIFRKF